jgi:hypothetical protein
MFSWKIGVHWLASHVWSTMPVGITQLDLVARPDLISAALLKGVSTISRATRSKNANMTSAMPAPAFLYLPA